MINTTNIKEMEGVLMKLGIDNAEARVTIILMDRPKGLKQKDIMIAAYMYQPEVSKTLKALIGRGWVSVIDSVPTDERGRPFGLYGMVKTWDEIICEIEDKITGKYEELMLDIQRAKDIVA